MSDSTFFVSAPAIRNLKLGAQRQLSGVASSHLSEGIAAALGFKTNASLRAALAGRVTVEVSKPSNRRLVQRLREIGYGVPDDLRVVPELERSYSPFRSFPLRKTRSPRWIAWRNLMVSAVNVGIERKLFGLCPEDNWWPGGHAESQRCERFAFQFVLGGHHTAVASVNAISGDELSICVIVNPSRPDVHPSSFCDLSDGDATGTCWVERRLGAWIQDGGEDFHCRRKLQPFLSGLQVDPKGYADLGSFFM